MDDEMKIRSRENRKWRLSHGALGSWSQKGRGGDAPPEGAGGASSRGRLSAKASMLPRRGRGVRAYNAAFSLSSPLFV